MTKILIWVVILIAVLGGGWYYMDSKAAAPLAGESDTVTQMPLEDGAEGAIIGSNIALGTDGNTTLGTYLIGYTGMPVYTKDGDSATSSSCYDACATNWPPYIVGPEDNINQLKSGVSGKTGTITRADGSLQMTYNGKPLYFYSADVSGSDAKGDGVNKVWHVVKP